MTEAIVSAVLNKFDLVVDEVHSLGGVYRKVDKVKQQLDEVKLQLGQMQCFLQDADSKRGDERIKDWVRDVRIVAYETKDAIDTFHVEANQRRLSLKLNGLLAHHALGEMMFMIQAKFKGWVRNVRSVAHETEEGRSETEPKEARSQTESKDVIDTFHVEANQRKFSHKLNALLGRRTLGEKISKIQAKLRIISEGRVTYGIQDLSGVRLHNDEVSEFVDDGEVVGIETDKEHIIDLLLHRPSYRLVVSIVGSGGLGKTTLAQKVYNSSTVRNNFDSCLWITVSQDFNLLDVLKKIHQKLTNETELKGENKEDQIVFLLGEVNTLLKEKKYLIVLDDVWTEHVFTQLETGLVDVGNGSRVLMTTRNLNVANYADSRGVYRLRLFSQEESLVLLLKKAIRSSDPSPECPEELKDLAKKLVQRCNGLPLALVVLGGLLSSKPCTYQEWSRVLERLDWHVVGGGKCMRILATSYDDLPYLLKSCFRYLACFPEDYEIQAKLLMKMWIAEGLVEAKNKGELEDYAEDYLEELVQRSLVQVVERSPDDAILSIRVHDIFYEVALGEATEKDSLLIWKEENAEWDVSMTQRVAIHQRIDEGSSINQSKDIRNTKMPRLRTFINFKQSSVIGIGFPLLRVLELNAEIRDLPSDLKNMIHLRYLGLRCPKVTIIPSWIGNLQNLQTFSISGTEIRELPKSFWNITSLRHVQSSFPFMVGPPSTANLVNLRSLGSFLVPQSWKKSFPHLPGVRELQLYCDDENDGMLIHNLMSKLINLVSVSFYNFYPLGGTIDFNTSPSYQYIHTMHLSANKPTDPPTIQIVEMPPNLAKLKLQFFRLNDDPMPKLEKLRGLKCLELDHIRMEADIIVCTNGGFLGLRSLELYHVLKMKEWKVEYGALPVLKYLLIKSCNDLRALPDLRYVPTLQQLEIDRELQSKIKNKSGEEWDKVKHIPTIIGPDN